MTSDRKKAIFISAFSNFVVRNILDTDFLGLLKKEENLRIVIIAPEYKKDYLKENFESGNVVVEGVAEPALDKGKIFLGFLSRSLLNTNTVKLFLRLRLNLKTPKGFLNYFLSRLITLLFHRSYWAKALLRKADYYFLPKDRYRAVFEKYEPDLVFSTDLTDRSEGESDIDLIREAKSRGVFVAGMVRSWDNLTGRGIIREVPDKIIVHNNIIKKECLFYNHIAEGDVITVGIPHYDNYLKAKPKDKKEFFDELGLLPDKKTILFVVTADRFLQKQFGKKRVSFNKYILELLSKFDPETTQILVRFPLIGSVELGDFSPPGNMIFDRPQRLFGKGELDSEAEKHLIDSLSHSDVVLPGPSTIALDALLFKKPVIFVAFDAEKNLPQHESIRKFFHVEHLRPLMEMGGARIANNEEEFFESIENYLKNPNLDSKLREDTVNKACWRVDGKSSQRLATVILDFVFE